MLIYEVNLDVDAGVAEEFAAWLVGHIPDVLAVDGFESAAWFDAYNDKDDRIHWTVQYEVCTRAALDDYLKRHAPRLRKEGVQLFGDQFEASRRVLKLRGTY